MLLSGMWTPLDNQLPNGDKPNTMLLLPDGRVMAQGGSASASTAWYALNPLGATAYRGSDAPDQTYVQGFWSTLQSMGTPRRFFASDVLPSGNVFVEGGEYTQNGPATDVNTGEVYNPQSNSWTPIADPST